jgi:hypothetical protein
MFVRLKRSGGPGPAYEYLQIVESFRAVWQAAPILLAQSRDGGAPCAR